MAWSVEVKQEPVRRFLGTYKQNYQLFDIVGKYQNIIIK